MSAHLDHKIPWSSLVEMYAADKEAKLANSRHRPTKKQKKQLQHIARTFMHTLQEFEKTHNATDEELRDFDPKEWGDYEFLMGNTAMGYYSSLVWGYVELNVLLADPIRIQPLMAPNGKPKWAMMVLLGENDCAHPPELSERLQPAFDAQGKLRPLTPDEIEILRKHAALLFRCMYIMSGENKLLLEETCTRLFFGFLGWSRDLDS